MQALHESYREREKLGITLQNIQLNIMHTYCKKEKNWMYE